MVRDIPENTIYVGRKPAMTYVMSTTVLAVKVREKKIADIRLKARGLSISKCVDTALIATNRFLGDFEIGEIKLWTENKEIMERIDFKNGVKTVIKLDRPKTINKSAIDIQLIHKNKEGTKDGLK